MSRVATADRPGKLRSKLGWTIGDQLIASATNAVLSILVARSVTEIEFGAFSLAFIVFAFAVGIVRAVVTDPLIIEYSKADADALRQASGKAAGASGLLGIVAGLSCVCASLAVGGTTRTTFLALALVLPGLLIQDAWRRTFFAAGRPSSAFANDSLWAVLQIGGALILINLGMGSVVRLVLVWGIAAAIAAIFGSWQMKVKPHPILGIRWAWSHRNLGSKLGLDFLISQGTFNVAMTLIAVVAGLAAAGALRAGQVLLGPVQVLFLALTSFALPLLATRTDDRAALRKMTLIISAGATLCTGAWVGLLLLLPDSVGQEVLGDSWTGARSALPFLGLQMLLIAIVIGATICLKSIGRAGSLVRLTIIQAPILLAGSLLGAYYWGAEGAAAGFVVAHLVGTVLGWLYVRRATASVGPVSQQHQVDIPA